MNDAYKDFLKDSAENQEGYQPTHDYAQMFYERKAAELEITVDYYIQEFL